LGDPVMNPTSFREGGRKLFRAPRSAAIITLGIGLLVILTASLGDRRGPTVRALGNGCTAGHSCGIRWPFLGLLTMVALIPGEDFSKFLAGEHTLIWFLGIDVLCSWPPCHL